MKLCVASRDAVIIIFLLGLFSWHSRARTNLQASDRGERSPCRRRRHRARRRDHLHVRKCQAFVQSESSLDAVSPAVAFNVFALFYRFFPLHSERLWAAATQGARASAATAATTAIGTGSSRTGAARTQCTAA